MDKLQPLIKYHFWLIFVLAFIVPPMFWYSATSELSATIEERTGVLTAAFDSIPKGLDAANQDWIDKANTQIGIRRETNIRTVERLWNSQQALIEWPPNLANYMKDCPYRGEITDSEIGRRVQIDYRRDYPLDVRRVWLLTEPIGPQGDPIPVSATKKVWFPLSEMPHVPAEKWNRWVPPFIEIWNSQEDLWLLEQLLLAVRRTNSSANSISDSFVRQIREVSLFGGTRVKDDEVASGGTAAAGGAGGESMLGGVSMGGQMGGPMGGQMGRAMPGIGRQGPKLQSARFDLGQEYKTKGLSSQRTATGGGTGMPMNYENSPTEGPDSGSDGTTADDLNADENRYIAVEDAYRTRGFHLVVTIHQQYVPDLIRELLNSQYPIDIMRIEQAALNPDDPSGEASGRPGGLTSPVGAITAGQPGFDPTGGGGTFETGEISEGYDSESTGDDDLDAFDQSTSEGPAAAPVTNEAVKAALQELDLVELAIVGEMYLYNPPTVEEGSETPAGDSDEAPPADAPAGTVTQPPEETPAVDPAGTPVPAQTGEDTPQPASGTPAVPPQSPQSTTETPETPGTAEPAGTAADAEKKSSDTTPESSDGTPEPDDQKQESSDQKQESSDQKQPQAADSGG